MSKNVSGILPQITFSILLALSLKPRHGYELLQQIEHDSRGRLKLGPGALYGNIKQLRDDNIIEEMPFEGSERRRYYRLTRKGWKLLKAEIEHLENTVQLAKDRRVLDAMSGANIWAS
jgi:DNA-binding PadR family transcriptional regulator